MPVDHIQVQFQYQLMAHMCTYRFFLHPWSVNFKKYWKNIIKCGIFVTILKSLRFLVESLIRVMY